MSAPAITVHSGAAKAPGRGIAAWWQALPLTAVFVLFFLIPLALILMVSFWDFNEYELLPAFTFKNYISVFEGCGSLSESGDLCTTFRTYL
ncbi:MAG: ABC transporter permease, partial [Burkholderiaceae bacterium]|nr:ABC transporter permease [Burkholderiaceae bacterium]